ncbi:MAG TPA: GNAT family N-acetyltransferase [Lysobacter sp.]
MEFPRWSEMLHDRSHVVIRPINKHDKEAERAFIEGLSAEARRYRFLGQIRSPSERMIDEFTDLDPAHEAAFVAVIPDDGRERIVGVSRYSTDPKGENCECAVTVSDEWQNKGLGTLLMKHLIEVAKARGIHKMTSIDSADNIQMADLARHLGFRSRVDPDDAGQVIHELDL